MVDHDDGAFQRLGLEAGIYQIEIRALGFVPLAFDVIFGPPRPSPMQGRSVPGSKAAQSGIFIQARPPASLGLRSRAATVPAFRKLLFYHFTTPTRPAVRRTVSRRRRATEFVGQLPSPQEALVIEHPDRRSSLHLEKVSSLQRDEVVATHNSADAFLLKQLLQHVCIDSIRRDVKLRQ